MDEISSASFTVQGLAAWQGRGMSQAFAHSFTSLGGHFTKDHSLSEEEEGKLRLSRERGRWWLLQVSLPHDSSSWGLAVLRLKSPVLPAGVWKQPTCFGGNRTC